MSGIFTAIVFCVLVFISCEAQAVVVTQNSAIIVTSVSTNTTYPLRVSKNGRYLATASNTPFLLTGDAAWPLYTVATVSGPTGGAQENIQNYFATRASQGFNAVLFQVLCGNYCGNSNQNGQDGAGNLPFISYLSSGSTGTCNGTSSSTLPDCYNMTNPNTAFFQRLCGLGASDGNACEPNSIVGLAAQYGLLAILLTVDPAGCPGVTSPGYSQPQAPDFFAMATNNGTIAMTNFGVYLASIFKNQPNIMWMGSEDFQCYQSDGYNALFADVIRGLRSGGDTHLATAEMAYNNSATMDDSTRGGFGSVSNVNGVYTYYPGYFSARHAYNNSTTPLIIMETSYEWNDVNPGTQSEPAWSGCPSPASPTVPCQYESTIRKQYWWPSLSGGVGIIWGNHFTDGMASGWQNELKTPGATEFATVWNSILSKNQWWNLVPDQTSNVLTNPGTVVTPAPAYPDFNICSSPCVTGNTYSTAAYANSSLGTTVIVYNPGNGPSGYSGSSSVNSLMINMTVFGSGPITATWYDPTNASSTLAGTELTNMGTHTFTPPGTNSTGDTDWVLVINGPQLQ